MNVVVCILMSLAAGAVAGPTPSPQTFYPTSQYVSAPGYPGLPFNPVKQQPYLQQLAGQYVPSGPQATPVYEGAEQAYLQQYTQQQPQPIQQVLLPTAVDRQVQRVAQQVAGPSYAQQVQAAQQQAQAQEALAAAQRKSTSQTFNNRQIQPIPVPQVPPQPQLVSEGQSSQNRPYYRTAAQGFKPAPPPPQQQQLQQQQQQQRYSNKEREESKEEEDFDSNPNYQFGFDVKDDLYTNYQNRKEQRDGDKISGSYSVVDADGFVRTVKYTADNKDGFKAEVTRQPTDIVVKTPKQVQQEQQPAQYRLQAASSPKEYQEPRQNAIYQYE